MSFQSNEVLPESGQAIPKGRGIVGYSRSKEHFAIKLGRVSKVEFMTVTTHNFQNQKESENKRLCEISIVPFIMMSGNHNLYDLVQKVDVLIRAKTKAVNNILRDIIRMHIAHDQVIRRYFECIADSDEDSKTEFLLAVFNAG